MKNFRSKLLSGLVALLFSAGASYALFTSSVDRLQGTTQSIPVLSACGGTVAGDAGSSDMAGTATQGGTVTTCTITFGTAFASKPACSVMDYTGTRASMSSVTSTTAITITGITAADAIGWICVAKAGG